MRAVQFEQPDLVATVAKSDEILAKDFNTLRHVAELTRNNHRLPKPPQVFAARRARPELGSTPRPPAVHRGANKRCRPCSETPVFGSLAPPQPNTAR